MSEVTRGCCTLMQSIIESFVPETTNPAELEDALDLSANYIRQLTVRQLLPRVKDRSDADDTASDDAPSVDHFDFNAVVPRLPFVEDLDLTYGVRDCGMNFDWSLFQFTTRDCRLLSECVAACRTLRSLKLQRSKVLLTSSVTTIYTVVQKNRTPVTSSNNCTEYDPIINIKDHFK